MPIGVHQNVHLLPIPFISVETPFCLLLDIYSIYFLEHFYLMAKQYACSGVIFGFVFFTLKSAIKHSYVTYSYKCLKIMPPLLESVLGM